MTLHRTVTKELLEKYATSAPRYTSYPTAVDWSKDFDPRRYPELLRKAVTKDEPLSVYVHLPYCAELCLYCGCNVVISRNQDRMSAYVDRLVREFEFVKASGIGRRPVRQYHWGGGTPTQLSLAQMERVQNAFEDTFHLAPDAEVAIEVDPRVTTREQIGWLAGRGWNRVSMGVQDFDPAVQEAVKRVQSEEETRAVIDAARSNGIQSVNIDLIYGLPLQTPKSFESTVERVLAIRPERVALFHYAHVPWMKKHQTAMDVAEAPSSDVKLAIFMRSVEQFRSAGYVYIGLDHFALPTDELSLALAEGKLQRNFMGYTTRRGGDMVSLGVSSIGDVAGCYVQNFPKEAEYLAAIDQHGHACHRGHELSADDHLRRDVILGLMCNGVLWKREIEREHGIAFDTTFATELAQLAPLEADGLVELAKDALRLTPIGQMFMRNVALPFDRYFAARKSRGDESKTTFSKTL
ncbi:MAG: oxygen-independent coproporphyrinogen III oxidase [Planctomycetes bacterium]|nr:oxygen-independent coproporphyrinogen III oxidase [Planctomycetota bacterium]